MNIGQVLFCTTALFGFNPEGANVARAAFVTGTGRPARSELYVELRNVRTCWKGPRYGQAQSDPAQLAKPHRPLLTTTTSGGHSGGPRPHEKRCPRIEGCRCSVGSRHRAIVLSSLVGSAIRNSTCSSLDRADATIVVRVLCLSYRLAAVLSGCDATSGYSYCHSCTDFQALMPRADRSGYDPMPVCAYCIENLNSKQESPRAVIYAAHENLTRGSTQ